ncbi:hypothetical protein B0H11DRAFT_1279915 [Mycena galericulata]|nr:hypothetical protein B0H11DRAFT_1279915 [Mycena galericulata]
MSSTTLNKKPKLQPVVSRISPDDVDAVATVRVKAKVTHAVHLRIQPLDKRPPIPTQIKIMAQGIRDMLAAGNNHIIKAVVEGGNVVGIAVWQLINKKAQLEDGVSPAPPREQTEEDEEALKNVDVELRRRFVITSLELRNKTMEDRKYWYLAFMAVDPAYQKQGIGQALLQWGLDQADAEVYLETSDEGLRKECF